MKRFDRFFWINSFLGFAALISLIACSNKETENTIPLATPPGQAEPTSLPETPVTTDSRLPKWVTHAAAIRLTESRNYTGLEDLFGIVYPPVVGDPKVALELSGERGADGGIYANGKLFVGFEDEKAFVYGEVPAVTNAGFRSSSSLDALYADSEVSIRISGAIISNKLSGTFFYRLRQSGENQCLPRLICYWNGYYCVRYERTPADPTACRTYLTLSSSNTQVKTLGTFEGEILKWIVKSE